MTLSFSIVINTLNRGRWLRDSLLGLRGLDYPDFEVVVVNGPSTDNTQAVLEEFTGKIKIAHCPDANLSMSRNIGIEASCGDVVAFIDDDAIPSADWLTQIADHYKISSTGGVGGFTIDNTGVRYQARKTICDRFGNAVYVSDFFDERPLCFPGSPFYPSLLGTNSSFRRSALVEIGGFDHVFAYLLDETDVCLRMIDAGYEIRYEPRALVYHQFAPSSLRSTKRLPKTLYPSAVSKSYFIETHGRREERRSGLDGEAARQLSTYREELIRANKWMVDHGEISTQHWVSLDQDVYWGIEKGLDLGRIDKNGKGDLNIQSASTTSSLLRFTRNEGLRIALVSHSFPPANDAGVARWTSMLARGLSKRGNQVHVIALATEEPYVRFEDGIWVHRVKPDPELGKALIAAYDLPPNIASWVAGVSVEVDSLRQSGLDVASFPIWDVEGVSLPDIEDLAVVMSLHTTYALALPYKPEWNARPLYKHLMVDKMISQESRLLAKMPVILANSEAIVADLQHAYSVDFSSRAHVVPHGTYDPFVEAPERRTYRRSDGPLEVLFVGRFEPRKGIDIAITTFANVHDAAVDAHFHFVGDPIGPEVVLLFRQHGGESLISSPRVTFHSNMDRSALDDLYATVDVVFIPSRYESFGLVAIEAMAAGAMVIAAEVGGLKEVVEDGENGYLVSLNGGEARIAADHIISLAKDRRLLNKMAAAARRSFEASFHIDLMAERVESVYKRAVQLKREDSQNVS